MWSPTHVQVTVQRAQGLIVKGSGGANNAYVTIQLGKEKFQTTLQYSNEPEWHEECDLTLLDKHASIILTALHRNFLGLDEFLGQVALPVADLDIYGRPCNRWYSLKGKPGKKEKKRGELEVRIAFVVRNKNLTGSLSDLSLQKKKFAGSLQDVASSFGQKLPKLPMRSLSLKLDPRHQIERLRNKHRSGSGRKEERSNSESGMKQEPESCTESSEDTSLSHVSQPSLEYANNAQNMPTVKIEEASPPSIQSNGVIELSPITESPPLSLKSPSPGIVDSQTGKDHLPSRSKERKDSTTSLTNRHNFVSGSNKSLLGVNSTQPRERHLSVPAGDWARLFGLQEGLHPATSEDCLSNTSTYNDVTAVKSNEKTQLPKEKEKKNRLKGLRNGRRHTLQEVHLPHLANPWFTVIRDTKNDNTRDRKSTSSNESTSSDTKKLNRTLILSDLTSDEITKFEAMPHQDLVEKVVMQERIVKRQQDRIHDLENYLDNLLVRVMETTPRILQCPYKSPGVACYR